MPDERWPDHDALLIPEELLVRDDGGDNDLLEESSRDGRRVAVKVVALVVALAMVLMMVGVLFLSGAVVWM